MNTQNLHELINRYEENYYTVINNDANDEIFKWEAVQKFRSVWFSDAAEDMPFSEMFNEARKNCAVLLDNSQVAPTNGIVKMAEICPDEVASLFKDVLFADYSSIDELQDHMDDFMTGIEAIRQRTMPHSWKYKQERHAVSCYLAFFAPEKHFIYRYSEAKEFAKYIEFAKGIGSGADFRLADYYEMAEIVVEALKQHPTLIEKYYRLIEGRDEYYYDESLHLMAFDLMYCCRTYNLYTGLSYASKKGSMKAYKLEQLRQEERKQKEAALAALQDEISELEIQIGQFEEISLINVEVTQKQYGKGTVIRQNKNRVDIMFDAGEKTFFLGNNYPARPRFENDEDIVAMFTQYAELEAKLDKKKKELKDFKI